MRESLGRYRVLKHLTSGGMADVLLGRSDGIEGFERHVVLKRIRAEHARDRRFISMFVDEARLAANLHHQHIVQVFDIGESNGEYFFAMEYIHGEDARQLLSAIAKVKGYVPLGIVCAIVSAVASGLHYAHERRDSKQRPLGIVHRDVSPSNVIIGYDGAVKIVDFGIAKASVRQSETIAGNLKGKCSYMSPEQCKSEPIDRRSDVYGLGVLLYELATTSRLIKAENDYLAMDAIVNGRFALPQVRRADLPNELSTIIMRALAADPARRYQTAEELRLDLEHFAATHDLNASTTALASYMKKIFGARPEPWVELSPADDEPATPRFVAPLGTGPTLKLGWEARAKMPSGNAKWLWLGVPVLAASAFGVWRLAAGDETPHAAVAAVAEVSAAPAPVIVELPPMRVVGPPPTEDVAAPAVEVATPVEAGPAPIIAPDQVGDEKRTARSARKTKVEPAAATPPTAAADSAMPAAAPAPAPAPAIVAPVPAPAPEPAPAQVKEPTMPSLSNATVAATAADHAAQLAACEGKGELHGDVAVSFQIDASGKVVRSQLASTIKNPKVAGCILRAVQSWRFARPPSGAATGVYSISYQ